MSWWGKLLGGAFGFMLGGPLGALIGAALGHNFDRGLSGLRDAEDYAQEPQETERIQTAFFAATFSVMGHLAKIDGRVSPDEIEMARAVMQRMALDERMREAAIRLFNEGKQPGFALDDVLAQFRSICHGRRNLVRMFVEIQLYAVHADGRLHPAEQQAMRHIAQRLGVSPLELGVLEARVRAERSFAGGAEGGRAAHPPPRASLTDAYAVLGVAPDASDDEVKKAYRRLMNQHHPDKLVSKGLPEEMIRIATEKTQEIKAAYERVRKARAHAG